MAEQVVPITEEWAIILNNGSPAFGLLMEKGIRITLDPLHKALIDKLITTNTLLNQLIQEAS